MCAIDNPQSFFHHKCELKVFEIESGKVVASEPLPDATESTKVEFNPLNWRQMSVWNCSFVSRFHIEDFVENESSILVQHRLNLEEIFAAARHPMTQRTEQLWQTPVTEIRLNFETRRDDLGAISCATWKDDAILFGTGYGTIHSLNKEGTMGNFLTSQDEIKNELTLQVQIKTEICTHSRLPCNFHFYPIKIELCTKCIGLT